MLSGILNQWQEFVMKHSRASGVSYQENGEQIISVREKNIIYVLSRMPEDIDGACPPCVLRASLSPLDVAWESIHAPPHPTGKSGPLMGTCLGKLRLAGCLLLCSWAPPFKRLLRNLKSKSWESSQRPVPCVYRWGIWCTEKCNDSPKDPPLVSNSTKS